MKLNCRILSGLIMLIFFMSGCGNNLSRDKAFDLVKAALPKPIRGVLNTGDIMFFDHDPSKLATARRLANDSVINFVRMAGPLSGTQGYKVSLSDKGKQYFVKLNEQGHVVILLGERSLVKITGMKMTNDNKKAEVEFEWKVSNLSPFGEAVQKHKQSNSGLIIVEMDIKSNDKTYQGTASISLYDDGWRIDKNSLNIDQDRLQPMS